MDKSILKDAILSQEVSHLMGQVPPLIEQVGTTLFQEINQSLSIDECCQFVSLSKKIRKDQKIQDKLNKSNKKNPRGCRGSKRN
ncbi:unnamed protein product [Paramecium primaurelia]|uniref:Uncharacterized protein n=1 Tax=Paramecium primaurelia TaxID=5886 RepID=A0A8S1QMI1_PARPR|nr:unnamed protein product [Paramecium primaurelia]